MPRRSVTEAARAREAQNPPSKRVLRSNTGEETSVEVEELPPPPEFANRYFYKDFGAHGLFVGICIRMARNGHRNGRDDAYCIRYDDGDVEDLCYSDLKKLCRRGPATEEAYREASKKRKLALEAKRDAERREAESRTKPIDDAAKPHGKQDIKTEPTTKTGPAAPKPKGVAAPAASTKPADAHGSPAATGTITPKSSHKAKKMPMKRKAKSSRPSSADEDSLCNPPPPKTLRTGLGWFNHTPCPIEKIESNRLRPTKEYLVRWGLVGQEPTWEPIHHLHAQMVNDYELQLRLGDELGSAVDSEGAAGVPTPVDPGVAGGNGNAATAADSAVPTSQAAALSTDATTASVAAPLVGLPAPGAAVTSAPLAAIPGASTTDADTATTTIARQLEMLQARHASLAESFRTALKHLEPPGWAATSWAAHSLPQSSMHTFPVDEFLKYIEHAQAERKIDFEAALSVAETARVEAVKRAESAESKLDMFLARQTQH